MLDFNEYLDDDDVPSVLVGTALQDPLTTLVTLCSETTGVWRDLATNEITMETRAGRVATVLHIRTGTPEISVITVRNPSVDEGDECEIVTELPNLPGARNGHGPHFTRTRKSPATSLR